MRVVVDVVHSAVIDVVAVFNGEPRVLLDLLVVLSRLHVYYIKLGGLLVVDSLLIHYWHAMIAHNPFSVIGQLRSWWSLFKGSLFPLLISLWIFLLAILLSRRRQCCTLIAMSFNIILQRVISPRRLHDGWIEEGHGVLNIAGETE